jgi:hypothetical protein
MGWRMMFCNAVREIIGSSAPMNDKCQHRQNKEPKRNHLSVRRSLERS